MAYQIVRKRCVVVVGKSGAGKSTVCNHLVDHDPLSSYKRPFPISKSTDLLSGLTTDINHEMVEFIQEGIKYKVTVIDTIGLFDASDGIKDDHPLFEKIEKYFEDHINGINVILFVFKNGRCTVDEVTVFSKIRSKLGPIISPISALAVTGCETIAPEQRAEVVESFQAHKQTKEIADQMTMGIHPVGFPPVDTLLPILQEAYKPQMKKDRETLMDVIIKADKPVLTKKMFLENVKRSWSCTIL